MGKASGVVGLATTFGATAVAKKAIDTTWKIGAKKKPPTDPTDPNVDMREAMLWAVLSGAAVGAAKMWASRRIAQSARNDQKMLAALKAANG